MFPIKPNLNRKRCISLEIHKFLFISSKIKVQMSHFCSLGKKFFFSVIGMWKSKLGNNTFSHLSNYFITQVLLRYKKTFEMKKCDHQFIFSFTFTNVDFYRVFCFFDPKRESLCGFLGNYPHILVSIVPKISISK